MKRIGYVDNEGNVVNQGFESKKPLLRFFIFFGTILPIILIIIIIYTAITNSICLNKYKMIEKAAYKYAKSQKELPKIDGEKTTISLSELYNEYLSVSDTFNRKCTGTVKITKYEDDYVYTLDVNNCSICSVSSRYGSWSLLQSSYPSGKAIVDVETYYNYYGRQLNTSKWSEYFSDEELQKKKSKYGVRLPKKNDDGELPMPGIPDNANIYSVIKEEKLQYRYKDTSWKWYDIVGDYSDFSSTQPDGYTEKDEDTEITTEWSDYSLNYPEERSYRDIETETGRRYYYEKNGKKIYANNGNYMPEDKVNTEKYDQVEDEEKEIFTYRDHKWRWYNGEKRNYSSYKSTQPEDYNYKDEGLVFVENYSDWSDDEPLSTSYRKKQVRTLVRYAYVYEFISEAYLNKPVTKSEFTNLVGMSVPKFSKLEDYKLEVTYKFKYRKR